MTRIYSLLGARIMFNCEEPLINQHITIECSSHHLELGFVDFRTYEFGRKKPHDYD